LGTVNRGGKVLQTATGFVARGGGAWKRKKKNGFSWEEGKKREKEKFFESNLVVGENGEGFPIFSKGEGGVDWPKSKKKKRKPR